MFIRVACVTCALKSQARRVSWTALKTWVDGRWFASEYYKDAWTGIPLRAKLARREACAEWKSIVTRAKVGAYLRNKIIQKISCECCFVLILQRFCMLWCSCCRPKTRGIDSYRWLESDFFSGCGGTHVVLCNGLFAMLLLSVSKFQMNLSNWFANSRSLNTPSL